MKCADCRYYYGHTFTKGLTGDCAVKAFKADGGTTNRMSIEFKMTFDWCGEFKEKHKGDKDGKS